MDFESCIQIGKHEKELEFDVDILKRDGISSVPHLTFKEVEKLRGNSGSIRRCGDIIKSITIEGKNIRKSTLRIGGNKPYTVFSSNETTDKLTIPLGKIGIVLLNIRFHDLTLEVEADEDVYLHQIYVLFPKVTRREICQKIEMIDDSIMGGLVYILGMCGPYESPEKVIFDWKECAHIRKIIDSKQRDEMVWLEEVPEIKEMIGMGLKRLNITETISGNKVTLGCYSMCHSLHRHRDNPLQGGTKSLLIYLNFTEGGETVFYEGDIIKMKVKPATGRCVIFGIYDEHEMLPLVRGKKYIVACELE